jgi:hypothetical protein
MNILKVSLIYVLHLATLQVTICFGYIMWPGIELENDERRPALHLRKPD